MILNFNILWLWMYVSDGSLLDWLSTGWIINICFCNYFVMWLQGWFWIFDRYWFVGCEALCSFSRLFVCCVCVRIFTSVSFVLKSVILVKPCCTTSGCYGLNRREVLCPTLRMQRFFILKNWGHFFSSMFFREVNMQFVFVASQQTQIQ